MVFSLYCLCVYGCLSGTSCRYTATCVLLSGLPALSQATNQVASRTLLLDQELVYPFVRILSLCSQSVSVFTVCLFVQLAVCCILPGLCRTAAPGSTVWPVCLCTCDHAVIHTSSCQCAGSPATKTPLCQQLSCLPVQSRSSGACGLCTRAGLHVQLEKSICICLLFSFSNMGAKVTFVRCNVHLPVYNACTLK